MSKKDEIKKLEVKISELCENCREEGWGRDDEDNRGLRSTLFYSIIGRNTNVIVCLYLSLKSSNPKIVPCNL
jgi:hypothetical protein